MAAAHGMACHGRPWLDYQKVVLGMSIFGLSLRYPFPWKVKKKEDNFLARRATRTLLSPYISVGVRCRSYYLLLTTD